MPRLGAGAYQSVPIKCAHSGNCRPQPVTALHPDPRAEPPLHSCRLIGRGSLAAAGKDQPQSDAAQQSPDSTKKYSPYRSHRGA